MTRWRHESAEGGIKACRGQGVPRDQELAQLKRDLGLCRVGLVIGGGEWLMRLGMKAGKRVSAVRESIEVVKLVSKDKPLAYHGKMFKVCGFQPKYATDAAPLVYAGANREQMLRVTVAAGDGVMYSDMPRGRVQKTTDTVREVLQAANRPGVDD